MHFMQLKFLLYIPAIICLIANSLFAQSKTVTIKNISSTKNVYVSLGLIVDPPKSLWSRIFSGKVNKAVFISPSSETITPSASKDFSVLAGNVNESCTTIDECQFLQENFTKETLTELSSVLKTQSSELANVMPVLIASFSEDYFTRVADTDYVTDEDSIADTGALLLTTDGDDKKFVDVVEWKNPGTNLQIGFLTLIRKWQDKKEPPYVQVVGYDNEFKEKQITVTSYVTYPVYFSLVACEVDIASLHEGRTCTFLKDIDDNVTTKEIANNQKVTFRVPMDIRVTDYFNKRPTAYTKIATANPYRVYVVASPFLEDIDQRATHTISLMRNILANTRFHRIASIDVQESGYSDFYLYEKEKGISFFVGDYFATNFTDKAINFFSNLATSRAGSLLPAGGPYVDNLVKYLKEAVLVKKAEVIDRTSTKNALSDEERQAITARKKLSLNFIKTLPEAEQNQLIADSDKISLETLPNLAFAPSGGGYRAAIATLGIKNAFSRLNLDPLFQYQVGLSGSTWYLSKLLDMAQHDYARDKSSRLLLDSAFYRRLYQDFRLRPQYNSTITNFLSFPAFEKEHDLLLGFFAPMLTRWTFLQELSLVDLMGAGLWYNLFRDTYPFDLKLSNFAEVQKSGQLPMTMMVAVAKNKNMERDDYLWFEFSPFEVGATRYDRFVKTPFFSRHYYQGKSVDVIPEPNLTFLMGIWGSAMSAGILEGLRQEVLPKSIQWNVELPFLGDILQFIERDYPALTAITELVGKDKILKSDVRNALKLAISNLDKSLGGDVITAEKIEQLKELKQKLEDSLRKLGELTETDQTIEIDDLSWLYESVKPYITMAYNAQPDRVSILSRKLTTAEKLSELQAFSGAIVGNPYYELDFDNNLVKNDATVELRDGGVDFNIPFPPLLKNARDVDIIVAFDASPDTTDKVKALENGCRYAERHNINRFPVAECLEYFSDSSKRERLTTDAFTVIGDPDAKDTITIIFIPLKIMDQTTYNTIAPSLSKDYSKFVDWQPHNAYTATMNLRYSPAQVDELAQFAELLGEAASSTIRDVYKRKMKARMNAMP